MKRLCALLIPVLFSILACGSQQSVVETAVVQTRVYEADLATALAGTLAAAMPVVPAATAGSVEIAPTATTDSSPATAAATVAPKLAPGSMAIPFGEKMVSLPRQETQVYGFQGEKDDTAAVSLGIFNARPNHGFCTGKGKNLTYSLRTEQGDMLDSASLHENQSTTKSVQLPSAGMYYISVTCAGSGCDAFCAEMFVAVTLEKN